MVASLEVHVFTTVVWYITLEEVQWDSSLIIMLLSLKTEYNDQYIASKALSKSTNM